MIGKKSTMIWNVPAILGGYPEEVVKMLLAANFEAVAIKAANGPYVQYVSKYSPWPDWGENVRIELVYALKQAGLKVYFWHFLYGYDPIGELAVAQKQATRFQPDGYIWNVEGAFDGRSNAVRNATTISSGLRTSHPDLSQGLCWWALPESPVTGTEWHPKAVAQEFLKYSDVGMPMMYWQGKGASAAVSYFNKSLKIWRKMTDAPIVPIGRSYNGDGGEADSYGITAFAEEVYRVRKIQNLVGNSWYSFDKAVANVSWLEALRDTPTWGTTLSLTLEEKVDRLVFHHSNLFPELY